MNNLRNSVQLIGHLGRDPEIKKFGEDRKIATVSIATRERRKNEKGGYENYTTWHRLIGWGRIAENMERFMKKGSEIAIQGKLVNRSYDDKNGIKRYVTEVHVNDFALLGKKPNKSTADFDVEKGVAVEPF